MLNQVDEIEARKARILGDIVSPADVLLADGPSPSPWPYRGERRPGDDPLYAWRTWRVDDDGALWSPFARPGASSRRGLPWDPDGVNHSEAGDCAYDATSWPRLPHPTEWGCTCGLRAVRSRGVAMRGAQVLQTWSTGSDGLHRPGLPDDPPMAAVGLVECWGSIALGTPAGDDWPFTIRAEFMRSAGPVEIIDPERAPWSGRWITCEDGHDHWGEHGAAGVLLLDDRGRVLLQKRGGGVSDSGRWSTIGGALWPDETSTEGALREGAEEVGLDPARVEVLTQHEAVCGGWTYTTVIGRYTGSTAAGDGETAELRWVDVAEVPGLDLLPAFRGSWGEVRQLLNGRCEVTITDHPDQKPPLRIGVDIDDVLYPWHERRPPAGATWQQIAAALDGTPYPGVRKALRRIQEAGHTVHLVTARGEGSEHSAQVREVTQRWLERHKIPHDSLHFTRDKASVPTDAFLDDDPGNCRRLVAAGVEAYLLDRPWNVGEPDAQRVASVDAFADIALGAGEIEGGADHPKIGPNPNVVR